MLTSRAQRGSTSGDDSELSVRVAVLTPEFRAMGSDHWFRRPFSLQVHKKSYSVRMISPSNRYSSTPSTLFTSRIDEPSPLGMSSAASAPCK
ncbi:unnamed protein product [Haemonchus placei]|uniref:PLAT domain-containing protein n=1 Tax=Haemonchus placei TaxID=6290 RepID=A0A0N4X0D9_HAEPC|nr:unnamed protein product [Haemonchus placei]